MSKKDLAESYFRNGYNCAQAILLAFSNDYNLDITLASNISCGFGAGMGRMQEICGALTGAYMIIGLDIGKKDIANNQKELTYQTIKSFSEKFLEKYKTMNCKDLLNCDLNNEEGRLYFEANALKEKVCIKCIGTSVEILESIIRI